MKRLSAFLLALALAANMASAQVWLQSGASGGMDSAYNYGASAAIQTVYQNISTGSLGFWVGENLDNGAFAQVGYEIINQSGYYSTYCSSNGCSGNTYLQAGTPTWFWEYFLANQNQNNFYGGIGRNASAGMNGVFNTYSFSSNGSVWSFFMNGQALGSFNLGTAYSGHNPPSALAEIANTNSNNFVMKTVAFKNVAFYNGAKYLPLATGYSSLGYGKGSARNVQNTYGVAEVTPNVDYFNVGSGLPTMSGALLWQVGYSLSVSSQYGNITGSGNYIAFTPVSIRAPGAVNISNSIRMCSSSGGKARGADRIRETPAP